MERGHRRRASEQLASAAQQLEREKARVHALQQLLQQHGIDFNEILHKVDAEHKQEDARFAPLSPRTRSAIELLRSPSDALTQGVDEVLKNVKHLIKETDGVTVQFKDLTVYANVRPQSDEVPTLWTGLRNIATGPCRRAVPPVKKEILRGITGELKPGTMTLLLGPPGSGKTVFMKALSGRLHKELHVGGKIMFNGDSADSGAFHLPKVAFYVDEDDEHAATLTVKETLQFAWYNATGGTHAYGSGMTAEEAALLDEKQAKINFVLRLFGLKSAMNTVVGNELLRGISGGEKKRLTSTEMCVTVANVALMDSISTGLDSASTYDIINTLRLSAKELNRTVLISLLQPPPEVFELFDDVMLISEGRLLYHGPKDNVLAHFGALGYDCPPDADMADFLQQVALPEGRRFLRPDMVNAPTTCDQFAQAFQDADAYLATVDSVDAARPNQFEWKPSQRQPYAASWFQHLKFCMWRQFLLVSRDKVFLSSRAIQSVAMGLLAGSLFYDLEYDSVQNIFGLMQYAAMFLALGSMPQIMVAFSQRPVLYKHADASLFPSSTFVISQTLVQLPISLLEVLLFGSIVYFLAGLANSAERFFTFALIIFAFQLTFGQLFRTLAAIVPTVQVGQPVCGLLVLLFSLFSGFMMARDDIPDYWIWVYWINPLQWVLQALAINQFTSREYDQLVMIGPGKTEKAGVLFLETFGYETEQRYIWYSILVLLGEYLLLTIIASIAYSYIRFEKQYTKQAADPSPLAPGPTDHAKALDATAVVPVENVDDLVVNVEEGNGKEQQQKSTVDSKFDLPFHPATIAFSNLWYTIQTSTGDSIDLLKGVHGYCKPGTLMALMGSSGAGKTTLLDVIAGRKTGGKISGQITVNGAPKNDAHFRRIMGYCEQLDVHSPHTTVVEALQFSAQLRLPASVDDAARDAFVQHVMSILELNDIADAVVGTRGESGLSFEQRKRLTIGVELVANPAILFLDEPTSGLDARSALIVMQSIRRVAQSGRTVICTIHQPSKTIFQMFDSLLLLKRGGEVVFFGTLGQNSSELIDYLSTRAPAHPFRFPANPATWMLEVIGAGTAAQTQTLDFGAEYRRSALCTRNERILEDLIPRDGDAVFLEEDDEQTDGADCSVPRTVQFQACLKRAFWSYWRTPTYNVTRLVMYIVVAVIFGSCFAQDQDASTDTELRSRLAVLYLSMLFMGIISMMTVMPVMAQERAAFYREQASNMYEVGTYAAAYGIVELPYIIFTSAVWTNVFYWLLGFSDDAGKYFFYWLYFGLFVGMMTFVGQFVACVTPSLQTGQLIGSVLNSLFNLFCGFMITPGSIPDYWRFLYWLAPPHYAYEGLVVTQFHGDDSEITTAYGTKVTAEEYVKEFFEGEFLWSHRIYDIIVLVMFMVFFRAATYLSLKFLRYQTR